MLRSSFTAALALFTVTLAGIALPRAAQAETTTLGEGTLSGELTYDDLVISGRVTVQAYDPQLAGTGTLHIKANQITVATGAVLSATAAGYAGVNFTPSDDGGLSMGGNGEAEMNSQGGGKVADILGLPGGGGGYFGQGASGAKGDCTALSSPNNATGGDGFYVELRLLAKGSAGGAANVNFLTNKGGSGGGMIILEAARIAINGTIEADGGSPEATAGVAPGGGSGGTIQIVTSQLSVTGKLSVKGGNGPVGKGDSMASIAPNVGGGGGGGVIHIAMPKGSDSVPILMAAEYAGGKTGDCASTPQGAGAGQLILVGLPNDGTCVDIDGDGFPSNLCDGTDCNDSTADANPTKREVCDGLDNNCDGVIDDGNLCEPGEICGSMSRGRARCIPDPNAGPTPGAGARPSHVDFEGGCGIMPGGTRADPPLWLGAAAPAAGALILALRARSARKQRKAADRS